MEVELKAIAIESIEMANAKAPIEVKRYSKDEPLQVMLFNQNCKGPN